MKPFDLKKALSGEPVVTRDGDKVIELKHHTRANQDDYCISGIIISDNSSFVETFLINGQLVKNMTECGSDLFMAETGFWINLFYNPTQDLVWLGVNRYQTKEEAEEHITDHKWYQTSIKLKI